MNINDLTLGQVKELSRLFNKDEVMPHPYKIGKNYIIRTVTMIFVGTLKEVTPQELVLTDAAWIPETERYTDMLANGQVKKCEPFPNGNDVIIGRGALIDCCIWNNPLLRTQK